MRFSRSATGWAAAVASASCLLLGACDGHKWDDTKPLFQPHHGHGEHGDHGAHEGHDDHGKGGDGHAEPGQDGHKDEKADTPAAPAEPKTLGLPQ